MLIIEVGSSLSGAVVLNMHFGIQNGVVGDIQMGHKYVIKIIIVHFNKQTVIKVIDARVWKRNILYKHNFILLYFLHWVMSLVNYENWIAMVKVLTAGPVPSSIVTVDRFDHCLPRQGCNIHF
jgi:hypothetical protein